MTLIVGRQDLHQTANLCYISSGHFVNSPDGGHVCQLQHTKQCAECSKALENFKLARTALFIMAGLLVGGGALLPSLSHRIPLVLAAGISALIAWRIQVEWIPMFHYKGYDHARIP